MRHSTLDNSQHWSLDFVIHENLCRACRRAMNLIRKEASKTARFEIKSRTAGWTDQLMLQILTAG
ncbi:hypothetical protein [Paludisphaera borealis]|uniref:Uncharacterized protein n=1 Tax=Paludisphaera borealis TaxID=1387353 RepID=A0A1U7CW83_9BACT|nr:hypothetical protein [Paludisphaera borealis]APW63207.1 hypothetical protein BSF38_04771 [Paludisphaera borealis]